MYYPILDWLLFKFGRYKIDLSWNLQYSNLLKIKNLDFDFIIHQKFVKSEMQKKKWKS